MTKINDIVLRPRFKEAIQQSQKKVLDTISVKKSLQSDFVISTIDAHIFIRIPKAKKHFWSPQLHLEVDAVDDENSILHGLFGPSPAVWTMFMFLHFVIACLFIGFGVWAYTNWRLDASYYLQIIVMILMVILWIVLYVAGRMGKDAGKSEMLAMQKFVFDALKIQPNS